MPKEIIISRDSDPKSSKYLIWTLDLLETQMLKGAIGDQEDSFPLLTTLTDYYEDFECGPSRLIALHQETITLEVTLEEHHRETPLLLKLLTMLGGLAALAHDQQLSLYGYAE